jgi:hypothetical protein
MSEVVIRTVRIRTYFTKLCPLIVAYLDKQVTRREFIMRANLLRRLYP